MSRSAGNSRRAKAGAIAMLLATLTACGGGNDAALAEKLAAAEAAAEKAVAAQQAAEKAAALATSAQAQPSPMPTVMASESLEWNDPDPDGDGTDEGRESRGDNVIGVQDMSTTGDSGVFNQGA